MPPGVALGLRTGAQAGDAPPVDPVADLGADVDRWGALGKVSVRVLRLVGTRGVADTAELAGFLGMRAVAVRHHLR